MCALPSSNCTQCSIHEMLQLSVTIPQQNTRRGPPRRCWRACSQLGSCVTATTPPVSSGFPDQRDSWASQVREATGREKHHLWQPTLDPPLVLSNVAVVLVSPKRPTSVGSVARAMSCFECDDLRIVAPRCDPLARSARNSSKGAQYLLWRAQMCDTLDEALQGAAATVAFTRWVEGLPASYRSMSELMRAPEMAQRLLLGGGGAGQGGSTGTAEGKVVLVFGREVQGLFPEEVAQCGAACSIPIGRLQESLSLSHAVSLALGPLFEARQADARQLGNMSGVVSTAADLAMGVAQQDD